MCSILKASNETERGGENNNNKKKKKKFGLFEK
jgi:hypothetical protein